MASIDLRFENPPLGYNANEVPLVDISQVDEGNQRVSPVEGLYNDAYNIPGDTSVILQRQSLHAVWGPQSPEELREHITETNQQLDVLATGWGITVASRRHIEATLVQEERDGELLTLVTRLPHNYESLDITTSNRHLQSGLWILDGLVKYAHARLADPAPDAHLLADIFDIGVYHVNERGQKVNLQDGGSDLIPVEGRAGYMFGRAMTALHSSLDWAVEEAAGKPMSEPFAAELKQQASDLIPR